MSDEPVKAWVGWWRPDHHQPWRPVCEAGDYGTAWSELRAAKGLAGQRLVRPAGTDPNEEDGYRR
jgi:hypothetical protein